MLFPLLNKYVRNLDIHPQWVNGDFYIYYNGDVRHPGNVQYDFSTGQFILKTDGWPRYFGNCSIARQNILISGANYKISLARGDGYHSYIPARDTDRDEVNLLFCRLKQIEDDVEYRIKYKYNESVYASHLYTPVSYTLKILEEGNLIPFKSSVSNTNINQYLQIAAFAKIPIERFN